MMRICFTSDDRDGFTSLSVDDHVKLFFPAEADHFHSERGQPQEWMKAGGYWVKPRVSSTRLALMASSRDAQVGHLVGGISREDAVKGIGRERVGVPAPVDAGDVARCELANVLLVEKIADFRRLRLSGFVHVLQDLAAMS